MADTFGLNGYMCEMTPTKEGYKLTAWDDKLPREVRGERNIKSTDLEDGVRPDDRAQVERLFRPLIDELDKKRDERVAKLRKDEVDRQNSEQKSTRAHEDNVRSDRERAATNPVAKDGTATNMNLGENPGKSVGGKDAEGSNQHSVDKKDENRAPATPEEAQAETTRRNAADTENAV